MGVKVALRRTVAKPVEEKFPTTFAGLIDTLGYANEQMAPLRKICEAAKKALRGKVLEGVNHTRETEEFTCTFTWGTSTSLDVDKIRETMGEDWCKQFEKVSPRLTITTKRK